MQFARKDKPNICTKNVLPYNFQNNYPKGLPYKIQEQFTMQFSKYLPDTFNLEENTYQTFGRKTFTIQIPKPFPKRLTIQFPKTINHAISSVFTKHIQFAKKYLPNICTTNVIPYKFQNKNPECLTNNFQKQFRFCTVRGDFVLYTISTKFQKRKFCSNF